MSLNTIKKKKEFVAIATRGSCYVTPYVIVRALRNTDSILRIGITLSRKVGKAVVRNKLRRRTKEIVRSEMFDNFSDFNYVMIFRKQATTLSFAELCALLQKSFKITRKKALS